MLTILGSIFNMIWRGPIWPLNEHENFTMRLNKICIWTPKTSYEANGYDHDFGFASHFAPTECFIYYKKWVKREMYPRNTCLHYAIIPSLQATRELMPVVGCGCMRPNFVPSIPTKLPEFKFHKVASRSTGIACLLTASHGDLIWSSVDTSYKKSISAICIRFSSSSCKNYWHLELHEGPRGGN